VILGALILVTGIALVVWSAERFTDGAVGAARAFAVSGFWIGVVVSGFEPENLATGIAAAAGGLPQVALGTVIGSAVFMLTAALGVAVILVPMDVTVPRAGALAMLVALIPFAVVLADGTANRAEGGLLVLIALGLLAWLYRQLPAFQAAPEDDGAPSSRRALALLTVGLVGTVVGAELVVDGVRRLVASTVLSETFLGMVVVGLGESVEETARMIAPARRGHADIALGNVVGTLIVLVLFNLGTIALVRPLVAHPMVLVFHAPYLGACAVAVAAALLWMRRLGRPVGVALVGAYVVYLAVNLAYAM
jgi:cation:H+ antiporter